MSSYLLDDLRNFNDIFRKDIAYDNIKSHKEPKKSRKIHFWKKPQGVKMTPPPSPLRLNLKLLQ